MDNTRPTWFISGSGGTGLCLSHPIYPPKNFRLRRALFTTVNYLLHILGAPPRPAPLPRCTPSARDAPSAAGQVATTCCGRPPSEESVREHGVRDGLADGMAKARQYLAHRNLESGSRDGSLSDDTSHQIWNLESGSLAASRQGGAILSVLGVRGHDRRASYDTRMSTIERISGAVLPLAVRGRGAGRSTSGYPSARL